MTHAYGIDVSHYQSTAAPAGVPWSLLKSSGVSFVMVRATYGTFRDPSAVAHVRAARAVGLQVGLYHFFRVGQNVTDQLAAFNAQALACGIRAGDICPALDIEDEPGPPAMSPSWNTAADALISGLVASFGEALVYITQRDFGRLGKPSWVLERPLWVAHYTASAKPATPGDKPWRIWQHRVGPFAPNGDGGAFKPQLLDQNRADVPLPVCTRVPGASGSTPPAPDDAPEHSHDDHVAQRLAAFTTDIDVAGHAARDVAEDERPTDPAPPIEPSEA